jgi:hypothetical protein
VRATPARAEGPGRIVRTSQMLTHPCWGWRVTQQEAISRPKPSRPPPGPSWTSRRPTRSGQSRPQRRFRPTRSKRHVPVCPLRPESDLHQPRCDPPLRQSRPKDEQQEKRAVRIASSATHWPPVGQLKAERTVSFHKRLRPHLRFVGRTGISFSKRTILRMRQRAPRPASTRDS